MKFLLIGLLFLTGCANVTGTKTKTKSSSEFAFTCEFVGNSTNRCENKETICYISIYTGSVVVPNCFKK